MVGAGFFALSPFAVSYASEARAYSVMMMLVVLSTLVLLYAIERNTPLWWIAYSLLTAAAMYTHYTSIFVLVAQTMWALLAHRERIRPLAVATVGACVLYLPWIPGLLADRHAPTEKIIGVVFPFGLSTAMDQLTRLVAADAYAPLNGSLRFVSFVLIETAVIAGLAGLLSRAIRRDGKGASSQQILIVVLALATPVGAALYSMFGDSVFVSRNLISSLPALCLAFAALLLALPRAMSALMIVLVVVGFAFGNAASLQPEARRPAYADAASYINDNAHPGDVVLQQTPFVGLSTTALPIHLDSNVPYFKLHQPNGAVTALRAARARDGRIFYVRGDLGAGDVVPPLVASRYRVGFEQTWQGLYPLTLIVYEPIHP